MVVRPDFHSESTIFVGRQRQYRIIHSNYTVCAIVKNKYVGLSKKKKTNCLNGFLRRSYAIPQVPMTLVPRDLRIPSTDVAANRTTNNLNTCGVCNIKHWHIVIVNTFIQCYDNNSYVNSVHNLLKTVNQIIYLRRIKESNF